MLKRFIRFFIKAVLVFSIFTVAIISKQIYFPTVVKTPLGELIDRLIVEVEEAERLKGIEVEKQQSDLKIVELKNYIKKVDDTNEEIKAIDTMLKGKLKGKGKVFYYAGTLYNVNPMLLASISIHETANGTSNAIKTKNNVGGIMANAHKGILKSYEDIDVSIVEMARLIKHYYVDKGLKDIESIGNKYCPEGVANDPTGLNKHWIPKVTYYYTQIKNKMEVST